MIASGGRAFVLNTRPTADSIELTQFLQVANIPVINDPLIQIEFHDGPEPDITNAQGLIFTSRNGVRAYVRRSDVRSLPVYAVGDATAKFARELGFDRVSSAGGNVKSLVSLILKEVSIGGGELLHIAGSVVAGDLLNNLHNQGYDVRRETMYEAKPAKSLSTRTIEVVNAGLLRVVVFFSPRTARTFARLIEGNLKPDQFKCVSAFCLSSAVASEISSVPWRQIQVARSPTLQEFLKLFAQNGEFEESNGERS